MVQCEELFLPSAYFPARVCRWLKEGDVLSHRSEQEAADQR